MKTTTKAKASVGVVTVMERYKVLKNGDFSKRTEFVVAIWVTCNEDEYYDITNAGPLHENLSNQTLVAARAKYPKAKGWRVYANESWSRDPRR